MDYEETKIDPRGHQKTDLIGKPNIYTKWAQDQTENKRIRKWKRK